MMGVFVQVNEGSPRAVRNPIGYVIQENGCWQWVGNATKNGYGLWHIEGHYRAHRVMYARFKGPIPNGLVLDHLCRNPGCVNPDHLEPVTCRENTLRGEGRAAIRARATVCVRGHPFDAKNTGWRKAPNGRHRVCRRCKHDKLNAYRRQWRARARLASLRDTKENV